MFEINFSDLNENEIKNLAREQLENLAWYLMPHHELTPKDTVVNARTLLTLRYKRNKGLG